MPQEELIRYVIIGTSILFAIIVIAYLILKKTMQKDEFKQIQQLRQGTKRNKLSLEVLYQKLYINFYKIPFLKRYVLKLRRRLEIINIEDEYLTRKQTASILLKALCLIIPTTIIIIMVSKENILLMCILLLFELLIIETITEGMVDKLDNKILKQHFKEVS